MSSSVVLFLNQVLGAFTLGTYPVRPFLLIGLAVLIACGLWAARHFRLPRISPKVPGFVAAGTLAALFIAALVLQVATFSAFALPQGGFAIFITNDELTNSQIAHNHFGKIVISTVTQEWFPGISQRADTGAALEPYVPQATAVTMLVLSLVALLATVLAVVVRLVHVGRNGYRFIPLSALVSFVVLEKSIDGGIISDGAGVAFAAFCMLIFLPVSYFPRLLSVATIAYGILLSILYHVGWYGSSEYFLYGLAHTGILFIAALAFYFLGEKKGKMAILFLVILVMGIVTHIYVADQNQRFYLASRLGSESYLAAYDGEQIPVLPQIGEIGRLKVYDASQLAPLTVQEANERYDLPSWYRVFARGTACEEQSRAFSFTVFTPDTLVSKQGTLLTSTFSNEGDASNGWHRYAATISYTPCVTRYLDLFAESVRDAGGTKALIYQGS